jgi:CheY-like chemotaxis protein
MNLITNAAEAMGQEAGQVTISTEVRELAAIDISNLRLKRPLSTGKYVCLQVLDTGSGMTDEVKARIFEPFFTTKLAGRGLGMSAVLGIVRGHRGAIEVESSPGQGSTFRVFFPVGEPHALAAGETAAETAFTQQPQAGRILVVDDEPMVRDVLSGMLQRLGFTVEQAANGQEAVDRLGQEPAAYRALFLDMNMPGLSPEESLRRMRVLNPDLPVVLCSGYGGEEVLRRMAGLTRSQFLQKPFARNQLLRALHGALAN